MPPSVFKFRSADPRALGSLKNESVWLPSAAHFNDPYDSSLSVDLEFELNETLRHSLRDEPPIGIDRSELSLVLGAANPLGALVAILMSNGTTDLTAPQARELQEATAEAALPLTQAFSSQLTALHQHAIKACSFTTELLSLVMWAHYAECHRGFCVAYSTAALSPSVRRQLYPVVYSVQRFSVAQHLSAFASFAEGFDPSSESAQHLPVLAAVCKAADWAYECEWRLIGIDQRCRSRVSVRIGKPEGVYLGARMRDDFRQNLVAIARSRDIPCYEMRLSPTRFTLEPQNFQP